MATAWKSCNVALFPSAAVAQQAIKWSQIVSGHFQTKYVLDGQTYYLHITLYQAHYPIDNLAIVQENLAKVAEKVSQFDVELHNFSVLSVLSFTMLQNQQSSWLCTILSLKRSILYEREY